MSSSSGQLSVTANSLTVQGSLTVLGPLSVNGTTSYPVYPLGTQTTYAAPSTGPTYNAGSAVSGVAALLTDGFTNTQVITSAVFNPATDLILATMCADIVGASAELLAFPSAGGFTLRIRNSSTATVPVSWIIIRRG